MKLTIPEQSLVVLVGASGCGKSSFARTHFGPFETISSDYCRGLVANDENDQSATGDAFDLLHYVVGKRLAAGRLTVVDATNVQVEARKPLLELARCHHALAVAIVLNLPERLCQERNQGRADRQFGPHVVRRQTQHLRRSLRGLQREGFHQVYVLDSPEAVGVVEIERQPLRSDRRLERGPFDLIGDVHGCCDELVELLGRLGYEVGPPPDGAGYSLRHPEGRKVVFLGDLVDRGPKVPDVLRLAMSAVESGAGLCVPGNHENKLLRKLRGRNVQVTHGLAETLEQLEREPPEFRERVTRFLDELVSHYVLDGGKLVVLERYEGRLTMAGQFVEAYRRYCWPVRTLDDFKLAPFHLLATEGRVHHDKDHLWHLEEIARLAGADEALLLATPHRVVDLADPASREAAIAWWEELTERGGEGMVVKPLGFVARGRRRLAQPAVKCRGREYLRIIYGPEYTEPANLGRLRARGLATKRSLALREFALGLEALERFVSREPLYRFHECVFGVLALESEPVDPRL